MRRIFRDAPDALRCTAIVMLNDGSEAQCGRYFVIDYARNPHVNRHVCTQHAEMILAGKKVRTAVSSQEQ